MNAAAAALPFGAPVRQRAHWHDRIAQALLVLVCAALVVFLLLPLGTILIRSVQDRAGNFVGLALFVEYLSTPGLRQAIANTLAMAALVTAITIPVAYTFAYALTRSCMPLKGALRMVALIPLLAPSLLAAISFIQLFGNQGLLKAWLPWPTVYGMPGMVMSGFYATFPHALMILLTALALSDGRLYEAAESLRTSTRRKFLTITLPGSKYGLISAALVVFSYMVSDFGIPKVIGGNTNVLAVEVYKQVIGQQDFSKGAIVALFLMIPALLAFAIDMLMADKQAAQLSARAVPYQPRRSRAFDWTMFGFCLLVGAFLAAVLGMAVYTSFIKLWPYNLSLSLRHYEFGLLEAGIISAYANSVKLALLCAVFGSVLVFCAAYVLEKTRGRNTGRDGLRAAIRFIALLPMGIPGLVLGLGYILFFNHPQNPLNMLYHTMAILVISTVVHFYTSSHLTAVTALKQIDGEFEAVSASLKVPFYKTFFRVTLPICLPAILEISRYYFINAMTTISCVVFLYSPDTMLASVSILNLDEAGEIGPAAAMATLIVATSTVFCIVYWLATGVLIRKTQAWRRRTAD